jgi:hypothetical protein
MYNNDVTDVRGTAGIGTITQDFTDARINEMQETAKDIIDAKTGRTDWSVADSQFELIKEIENLLAAALILGHGGPQNKQESEALWLRGMSLLDIVVSTMSGAVGADADLKFTSSQYMSHPLGLDEDPFNMPHKSTRRYFVY